ncbi:MULTISPECIES: hypothetical protein [unclassified Yoonia]|uniref:hypothetical protein n=1 Tax=unclassified Yoonia TaxID=2629118 RepID=UPI002AFFB8E4|nr:MULTISPECIES: hypothetical protein [unclassified Yoonia]
MAGRTWATLPRVVRFLITYFVQGAVAGCVLGLVLIRTDTAGIGTLLESHNSGWPTLLFFLQGAVLFGTLASIVAVANLDDDI